MAQPSKISPNDMLIAILCCGVAGLFVFATIASLPDLLVQSHSFILLYLAAFALMLAAYYLCKRSDRRVLAATLAFAVLFRIVMLFAPVTLSADIFRYIWDGRVTIHGVNPYRYAPNAPQVAHLQDDDVYPLISSIDHYTIYPPLAEAVFAAGAWLGDPSPLPLRLIFTAFDLGCLALLIVLLRVLGGERRNMLLWAWNPLPIVEFAGSGHSDSMMIFFLMLAVWGWSADREKSGWLAFGGSIAARLVPIIALPLAVAAVKPRKILAGAVWTGFAVAVCAAPYLTDWHLLGNWMQSSRLYAGTFIFNASFFATLLWARQTFHLFHPATEIQRLAFACNLLFGLLWVCVVIAFWRRSHRLGMQDYLAAVAWLFTLYFILTPNVQVWYVTWPTALVPLIYSSSFLTPAAGGSEEKRLSRILALVSRPHTALLVWSGLVTLAYEGYAGEVYGVPASLLWLEYGTLLLLALLQYRTSRKRNVAVVDAETRAA